MPGGWTTTGDGTCHCRLRELRESRFRYLYVGTGGPVPWCLPLPWFPTTVTATAWRTQTFMGRHHTLPHTPYPIPGSHATVVWGHLNSLNVTGVWLRRELSKGRGGSQKGCLKFFFILVWVFVPTTIKRARPATFVYVSYSSIKCKALLTGADTSSTHGR